VTRLFLLLMCASLCLAQGGWETATQLPGVDMSALSKTDRDVALKVLRSEKCQCGCDMKIARCRMEDPACGVSRRFANFVVREASLGKTADVIKADLEKFAKEPPPLLDDPVAISIAGDPMKGPSDAKVTVVEFSDFQCPYCALAAAQVVQVMQKFPKDVRVVFKQFPLDTHSQAASAAEAALAAQAQGKFWEMHDRLYENFRRISPERILAWAQEIGLDMNRFRADWDSHRFRARVEAEEQEGETVGVDGTPTFFIDGKKLNGMFDAETVVPLISQELKIPAKP